MKKILFLFILCFLSKPTYATADLENKQLDSNNFIKQTNNIEKEQFDYKKFNTIKKKKVIVKSGDNFSKILNKNGISIDITKNIIENIKKENSKILNLKINQKIVFINKSNKTTLIDIYFDEINFYRTVIDINNTIFGYYDVLPTKKILIDKQIKISKSILRDGANVGVPKDIINKLVDIFIWDIDFSKDIAKNDIFYILYEANTNDDEIINYGNIIGAVYKSEKDVKYAFWFDDIDRKGYFDENGHSLEKAFLKNPVKNPFITSGFTTKRFHPVLNINRPHRGVDYGGGLNTEIVAVADGKVTVAGKYGSYGNAVMVDHGMGYVTLYAHLNKVNKNIKVGNKVKQSQIIGYMGQTGLASGVHLHFEFRVNGEYKDPLKFKFPEGKNLKNKINFEIKKMEILESLNYIDENNQPIE